MYDYKERYREYLNSNEWKKLKRKVIARDNGICCGCGEKRTLDVHHLTYDRVGNELMTDLISLCSVCHARVHGDEKQNDWHDYIKGKSDTKPKSIEEMTAEELRDHKMKIVLDGAL